MSGEACDGDAAERLYFVYGSETGNAESIAKRLHHDATTTHGFPEAECMTLNQVVTKKLLDAQLADEAAKSLCFVIVCSTMGEGEPPQNASRFRRWLRNTTGTLRKVRYCVLALGDTNYNNFCAPGIFMDNRLNDLGAVRCYPRGEADDGVGLHLVVDPWMDGLWAALRRSADEPAPAVGRETYSTGETRVDMSVAQEAAILYSNAVHLCAATALFLYERIIELGGKADLYPIQYFNPSTSLTRPPKVVLFVLGAECDADTLCEQCAAAVQQLPPLGPFSAWVCGSAPGTPPAGAEGLQRWLADPAIRFFNSLFICPKDDAAALDASLKAIAAACKLEFLCRRQGTGELPSIAAQDADTFSWIEGVLDSLPGVTADTARIHGTMEHFFDNRLGAAFRAYAAATALPDGRHGAAESDDGGGTSRSASTHTRRRFLRHSADAEHDRTGGPAHGTVPSAAGGRPANKTHQVLDDLLTPVVFLYSDGSAFVKQVAMDIFSGASQHHLRSSICELSNFRQTGFPRRATFVFVVSGVLTRSMARVLKVLRSLQAQGKQVDGVSFAIVGIDSTSQSDRFNTCALELETLLLEMKATKIHCTGLADADCSSFVPILQSWEANLWSAIVHPMKSAAYLDVASPSIVAQRGPLPAAASSGSPTTTTAAAAAAATEAAGRVAAVEGATAAVVLGRMANGSSSPFPFPLPGHSDLLASAQLPSSSPVGGAPVLPTGTVHADSIAGVASFAGALFPWDTIPLHKENTQHTSIAFLYASAGMSKTTAAHAIQSAQEKGFPAALHAFADFQAVDYHAYPNLVLFCEAGPDGQSNGGRRFKKFLTNPSHRPDALSFVRFAVLGLGATAANVVHPAFLWAKLLSRLQANRVFPVVIMASMSQLHSLAMPWIDCVLSSMALMPPPPPAKLPEAQDGASASATVTSAGAVNVPEGGAASLLTDAAEAAALPAAMSAAAGADEATAADPHRCVVFLFGSSTGITESIARDLHREALGRGFFSRVAAMKYFQKMNFLSTATVVLVCSTIPTAPGGFPRNARSFARYLLAREQPSMLLGGTAFAVLGLGNGAATAQGPLSFCRAAVRLDRRMAELGGTRLCDVGTVDAAQAIAAPVEAWRTIMFAALEARATAQQRVVAELAAARPGALESAAVLHPVTGLQRPVRHGAAVVENLSAVTAAATARAAPARQRRAVLAYCCTQTSVVSQLVEYLSQLIRENTTFVVTECTMNALVKRNWRSEFDVIVFVVGEGEENAEYPLNGTAFSRVVRQRTAPLDMFAAVAYTVLAVSDNNAAECYTARQLDRRVEELGGTRVHARGEVVDSFRLERAVEKWSAGLLGTLVSLCDSPTAGSAVQSSPGTDGGHHHRRPRSSGAGTATAPKTASSTAERSSSGADALLRRLHRTGAAATTATAASGVAGAVAQGLNSKKKAPRSQRSAARSRSTQLQELFGGVAHDAAGATTEDEGLGEDAEDAEEEGGEDAQSSVSAEVGSRSADKASTLLDGRTEASMVNRVAYSADNAGDRADGVVQSWTLLTCPTVRHPVLQLNLSVAQGTQWSSGQTIAVLPSNNAAEVEALLRVLRVRHHEPFHPLSLAGADASAFPNSPLYAAVDFPVSCGMVLLRYVEVRVSAGHKALFQLLERHCSSAAARVTVQEMYTALLADRTPRDLREVLEAVAAVADALPPFRHIVENLALVQPRQYSICSSHRADPTTLSICFKVVEHGLCTGWMYEQCLWAAGFPHSATAAAPPSRGDKKTAHTLVRQPVHANTVVVAKRRVVIPFVIRRAAEFRMPRDPLVPMILIGPGTGIAPFRAFLQERQAWLEERQRQCGHSPASGKLCGCPYEEATHHRHALCGSIDVFFGCRRRREDYLYRDELTTWEDTGVVHSLTVAFSRDVNDGGFWYGGCYVQDKMMECGVALMDLVLQRNAHVFVCGDADNMAKEVHNILRELIQQHLSLTEAGAAAYLDQMSKDGRYLRDVWSTGL